MIKFQNNELNAYTSLGLRYYQYKKKVSGIAMPKSKLYYTLAKVNNKITEKTCNFNILKDNFIISDIINKNKFYQLSNIILNVVDGSTLGENENNLPVIDNKTCINSLIEFEGMGGTVFSKNDNTYNNLFKEEIPDPMETYYWYNTQTSREGIRIKNTNNYKITHIDIYGSYQWALEDCKLEAMSDDGTKVKKILKEQDKVSNTGNTQGYTPMYYEGTYNGKIVDFVRYTPSSNNCITRILVFGNTYARKVLLEKNGKYYSISDDKYDTEQRIYNPLEIENIDENIFNDNSFNIQDLFTEKNIGDENFKPIDKFNNFKLIILTKDVEEIQKINEIKLYLSGEDIPPIEIKEDIEHIKNNNKLFEIIDYEDMSTSIICNVLQKKRKKFVLQPFIQEKITLKVSGKKENEEETHKGDIKGFTFIVQKGHFVELNLDFIDKEIKIDFVSNLPDGLIFENGKIKGTPLRSGKTELEIHTTKNQVLYCNIEVPPLIRLL